MGAQEYVEVPAPEKPSEVAIELETLYTAIENAASRAEQLAEKLRPVLGIAAFQDYLAEDAPKDDLCPLASEIRRDTVAVRAVSDKLAELLKYIQL